MDRESLRRKRFEVNMARVNRLMNLAQRLQTMEGSSPDDIADLYRSTIVFLHASFEDVLRTAYTSRTGKDETLTFGGPKKVRWLLEYFGLSEVPYHELLSVLASLMRRRHAIVHRGDLKEPGATSVDLWRFNDDYQLVIWIFAVVGFVCRFNADLHIHAQLPKEDANHVADLWFANDRTEIVRRLVEARKQFNRFSRSLHEERMAALKRFEQDSGAILASVQQPSEAIARLIFEAQHESPDR